MTMPVATETIQRIREQAAQRFEQLGWPTTRTEEWRHTNLAPVAKTPWQSVAVAAPATVPGSSPVPTPATGPAPEAGAATLCGRGAVVELVFVNGVLAETRGDAPRGVTVRNLAAAGESIEEHFARYADYERNALTALNTANAVDGAVIELASGVTLDGFIHLLFVGRGDGVWSHPRNLIVAGRSSQVTIIESYVGSGAYFTNAVTELVAQEDAIVDHYKIECESLTAYHVGTVQIHQERSSTVTQRNIAIGGALARTDVNVALTGEGASITLDGLFTGTGTQHLDNHTVVDHAAPHCESHELYKGILDQNARGVFDGRVIVEAGAQKTVSKQENRNLLLSESAIVDSKPTLEILNDDVKCNHGSTIGQLEEEPMFYLRSRGIGEEEARNLLVYAFAGEIVDRMKAGAVREQIRRALFRSLPDRLPERRAGGNDR